MATLIAGVIALVATLAPTSANAVIANSALAPVGASTFDLSCTGNDPATSAALSNSGLNPFTMATAISTSATDSPSDLESFTLDVTWQFTLPASFVALAQSLGLTTVTQSNSTLSMTATSGATGASAPTDPGPTVINLPGPPTVDLPFQSNPVQVTFTRSGTGPVVLAPASVTTTLATSENVPLNLLCTPTGNVTPLTLIDQAAPTIGTAAAGNGQATVSWTPPFDGGSPIVGYVVVAYDGLAPVKVRIFNSTLTNQTITGLTNGTQYRFRVSAYNAIGNGPYSKASNPVTPAGPTPPSPPTIGTAVSGDGQAMLSWTEPSDGGSPIVGYVVVAYVGLAPVKVRIFNSTLTNQTITGLTNGTQYRFRVSAYNATGNGPYSKASNPITPNA
jgi:titin